MEVSAVHNINRSRLREQLIKDIDIMDFGLGYGYKRRDITPQVK